MELQRVRLASGIELATVDCGPRDAPALIFLHGFPESHRSWRHQIAHFSDRYRCIAPDQRGYGASSKPPDVGSYSPDKLIADIFQLADALGVERFTIVGHDWGGVIAWGVAMMGQMNGRVTRAVIANAPHPALFQKLLWLDPAQRAASQYITTLRDPANDELVRQHGLGGIIMKAFRFNRPPARMEPEERAAQLAAWQDRDTAFAMLNWYRASPVEVPEMDAAFALPSEWQEPAVPRLSMPTLVIWADEDEALLTCNLDGLPEVVENLNVVRIPHCGHFVTSEAPEAVNAAMEAFF